MVDIDLGGFVQAVNYNLLLMIRASTFKWSFALLKLKNAIFAWEVAQGIKLLLWVEAFMLRFQHKKKRYGDHTPQVQMNYTL